ncbi:MAG: maltokinase N-terminal cap-like domain-containing protein [Pseudonocardia sp.]
MSSAPLGAALLEQLAVWLPRQRWFAAKGRHIAAVRVAASTRLREAEPTADLLLLDVEFVDGGAVQRYQLILGRRTDLPGELDHVRIGSDGGQACYDGIWDPQLSGELLSALAAGARRDWVRFTPEPGVEIPTDLSGRVLSAEQSNTSVAFGEELMLKMYRRVAPGMNPDLELHRALRGVGSAEVAGLRAAVEATLDDGEYVLGLLQDFAANSADGWSMALISIRDLFAEGDLRADEVGGDFAGEAHRLGRTVAMAHDELARALGTATISAVELAGAMHARLAEALPVVAELAGLAAPLRAAYDKVAALTGPVTTQRLHGDLHLGQTLRTPYGWLLIDFEGEPARPLAERRRMDAALRDVAGMLRSFDYAAYHQLAEWDESAYRDDGAPESQFVWHADEWTARNRSAFCDGYAAMAGHDPRDEPVLLRAFELDKAVYEAAYEARNRPSWLPLPLRSLRRLLADG